MTLPSKLNILDSTLRDGAQAEGISFSVQDKLKILKALDELGVSYIEAGNPGSNPKDLKFFEEAKKVSLKHAKLAAFGSTRRKGIKAKDDSNVKSLLLANTPVVVIFGKSWDFHVTEIIKASLEENLEMIKDTISFLKDNGKEVIFDAEHFFDGYKNNKEYALKALKAAEDGGADVICLCETNGGAFPSEVAPIVKDVASKVDVPLGIHTHNDTGMAVANSIAAVENGAVHVQGTMIGIGERCGNANLSTIIGNMQVKKKVTCIKEDSIAKLTPMCRMIAEIANTRLDKNMPYVGKCAFTHKGGMHIDGVNKASRSFEHVPPECVGNARRLLMSEVAGRGTIVEKIQKIDSTITKEDEATKRIIDKVKQLEFEGYQFEGADGSFELLVRKELGTYKPFFKVNMFKTIGEKRENGVISPATALIKVTVGESEEITAAEGKGPVDALDSALRKALVRFYPCLMETHLTDYKVRVLDTVKATAATTRVLIESSDGKDIWTTVGVSDDIINASLVALIDSIDYKLSKSNN